MTARVPPRIRRSASITSFFQDAESIWLLKIDSARFPLSKPLHVLEACICVHPSRSLLCTTIVQELSWSSLHRQRNMTCPKSSSCLGELVESAGIAHDSGAFAFGNLPNAVLRPLKRGSLLCYKGVGESLPRLQLQTFVDASSETALIHYLMVRALDFYLFSSLAEGISKTPDHLMMRSPLLHVRDGKISNTQ